MKQNFRRSISIAGQVFRRDLLQRYRGSNLGLAWTFISPLLMLSVYTFIFGSVLQMRWTASETQAEMGGTFEFALTLFVGLVAHACFAETVTRAPTIIVQNANMVKRVVFPLAIFPGMVVSTAVVQYFISTVALLAVLVLASGHVPATVLWIPVIVLPFAVLLVGLSLMIASVGVYFRDIVHLMGFVATASLFLSPVFYPASMLPDKLQFIFALNPLTFIIEQSRAAILAGQPPDALGLMLYSGVAVLVLLAGLRFFARVRPGFADVL